MLKALQMLTLFTWHVFHVGNVARSSPSSGIVFGNASRASNFPISSLTNFYMPFETYIQDVLPPILGISEIAHLKIY